MIRELTETDRVDVLTFLYQEPEINLYLIGDIKNYGFQGDNHAVYAEFKDDRYHAVLGRNHSHLVYYAIDDNFNPDWVPIIKQFDYLFLSGKAPLMEKINPFFDELYPDRLDFMKSTAFVKDDDIDYDGIIHLDDIEDARQVYRLLNRIDELDSVRKKTEEEFVQYLMENTDDNGTTVFYKEDGKVVASASAVHESQRTAMIVGVATHPDYREQGLGKKVLHYLVDLYVNKKNKTLCLYFDDPRAGALYEQLGFVQIDDWIMLIKTYD